MFAFSIGRFPYASYLHLIWINSNGSANMKHGQITKITNITMLTFFGNMTRLKCVEVEYCNFWNEGGWDETNNTHNISQIPWNMYK